MSRNAFAQLDSDESDNEDMKTDNNVGNTEEDANSVGETNNINNDSSNARKTKMSLKAQWERSSSRGQYSPSRSSHKTADIKKEFAAFGQSTSISNRNRVRYSKEDILALYKDNLEKPVDVKGVPKLIVGDCLKPVVLKPMGYEELNGIWDFHLSKRQGRRGGNNTRFQRNTGNQRGNNDARRARSDGSLSGQNDRWGGRNDSNRSNNNTDRSGGRWGRLDGSDGNNRNNNNNATFGGNEWRRGQKPQVSNRNRNDMNNEDTFGDGMLGVGGADNNTFEDFAANSAKFEQEMANLRKNAGMGLWIADCRLAIADLDDFLEH